MLEPDARHLLLDALRPPSGYALDMAVGTTYSLDLLALMTAPVAFAMFDRQTDDGSVTEDPITLLQALREHASRITIFCQAGQIAVPPAFRSLLVYLEGAVHPVIPPNPEAIFHPKVWYLRFRRADDDSNAYRLLCLSRNLTFDRSWDTVLRLEGSTGDTPTHPELQRFAESLVAMAQRTRPVKPQRAEAVRELGVQFARVRWTLPDGFDDLRFWPLGDDGVHRWPFEGRRDRMLVVSPFVTEGTLGDLTKRHKGSILVSRPETFDGLGQRAVKHLAERLVLSPDASLPAEDGAEMDRSEATAESADHRLEGLHAKTYVADAGRKARVWTGSSNATHAAFRGNVEFMVELAGRSDRCGVRATIGDHADRLGLRKLVEPYEPLLEEPAELTDAELIERRLDQLRRAIGGLRFTACCAAITSDRWRLILEGGWTAPSVTFETLQDVAITVRPLTLGEGSTAPTTIEPVSLRAVFDVSEDGVTPYFVFTVSIGESAVSFLIAAELIDPPPGRAERVLTNLLTNQADLIRFLLLLLGNVDVVLGGLADGSAMGADGAREDFSSEALLEPLVRAYSRDPERLREIEGLLAELRDAPGGASILPNGWNEVWEPISGALARSSEQ